MPTIVPPSGPTSAKIVIVGDCPTSEEEAQGQPFLEGSGHLLNDSLARAGLSRSQCYLTNVLKFRPPSSNFGVLYDDSKRKNPSAILQTAWTSLSDELRSLRPNVILLLGPEALRAVTGRLSIHNWRGSLLWTQFGKALATHHPSTVLREYSLRPILDLDFKRMAEECGKPDLVLPQYNISLSPSLGDVLAWLRDIPTGCLVSADIETTGSHVRCLGLARSATDAMVIPFISRPRSPELPCSSHQAIQSTIIYPDAAPDWSARSYWTVDEEKEILNELDRTFRRPDLRWVLQNYPFDSSVLAEEFGLEIPYLYLDTMVGWHCCYAELPKGLDFLASVLTRIPYYSDYDPASDLDTWKYCGLDCLVTWQAAGPIEKELRDLRLWDYYREYKVPQAFALARMSNTGFPQDMKVRAELSTQTRAELEALSLEIKAVTGEDFNPRSFKDKAELFYKKLGLPIQYKRGAEGPQLTTDKNALDKLIRQHPDKAPILLKIKHYSELATLLSTFLEIELEADGKFYTSFNQTGTENGRLSSSKPLFRKGGNMQNIPKRGPNKKFRRVFCAPQGWVVLKADLSQAQFWIVVWLARIERFIKRYYDDPSFDIHRWLASVIYQKPESEIISSERDIAKNGIYGGSFKMYYVRASQVYNMDLAVAKKILDTHRQAIPEIPLWWAETEGLVGTTGRLRSPLGGQRIFFGRRDDETFRQAYACLPQMVESEIVGRALCLLTETFPPSECYPVAIVHDEIVCLCLESKVDFYAGRLKDLMEYPITFPGVERPLLIKAEVSWGPNWSDQTKWKGQV